MAYAAEFDPLCYPGTTVLINLLDVRDQAELDEVELALFLTRADEPLPAGELDYVHYLSLHRHLFQDVYGWAGQARTIRIGKAGSWFCYPEHIASEMARVFRELGNPDHLADLDTVSFAKHLAHIIAEINAVHPFREGNGRTQLTFLAMLAEHAGFTFNADILDRDRVIQAMIDSFSGSEAPLQALIEDIIA
ncbi:adenosine monophosphate-protein transferase [Mesorhizobium loti]|uniref:protein adenylyltransferase n=1 Tax=Mesorhizobium jarvisii TaxID=1777867 RepID=A0A6M7T9Z2_9HYPH|nr:MULTISPECIES: Fic family protein [Mesorhizobium]OBQ60516.1 adenosine monophosphate-protein transferase [Mesorhizobium loti]QKC61465.1 adenosine monophosphate-protein transferase [Mesorhizobium jarvisii]QKD07374.1 adenosine monophosphate-protein transferase [Mesorhizobium loti]RJT31717.1 adenosine monophosphate-protein transferase [Mesorhizobium jarvisii]BCG98728.1 putative adenosine monophosphate-protein transferase y4lH [Mesorhizobium sp. 131-2-5]